MFPPRLHVIDGGSRPSEQVEAIGPGPRYLAASPARCVQLAEAEAGRAADLLAPAIALMFKSPADIIEIAGIEEVVRARDAFREGAAAARGVGRSPGGSSAPPARDCRRPAGRAGEDVT